MADVGIRRRLAIGLALLCLTAAIAAATARTRAASPPPRPTGCQAAGPSFRLAGPPAPRVVALTFDDGPGPLTASVLDVLERERVPATFFPVGRLIAGNEHVLRRVLATGGSLGNHSYTHAHLSGGGLEELRSAQAAIHAATGYTPCVFRAPANKHSPLLVSQARSLGLLTVQWSADSRDWSGATASAIHANVLARIRPGGVVLMHDEGPNRVQTLRALPSVIRSLRRRGYRFVTVPRLLRLAPRYG